MNKMSLLSTGFVRVGRHRYTDDGEIAEVVVGKTGPIESICPTELIGPARKNSDKRQSHRASPSRRACGKR